MRNIILIATLLGSVVAKPVPIPKDLEDGPDSAEKAASPAGMAGPPTPADMAGPADAQTTPAVDGSANSGESGAERKFVVKRMDPTDKLLSNHNINRHDYDDRRRRCCCFCSNSTSR